MEKDPWYLLSIPCLQKEEVYTFEGEIDLDFIDRKELEVELPSSALCKFFAYQRGNERPVISLSSMKLQVGVPCAQCSEQMKLDITVNEGQEVLDFPPSGGQIDLRPLIQELILANIPFYSACSRSDCPRKADVDSYIKGNKESSGFKPFSELLN